MYGLHSLLCSFVARCRYIYIYIYIIPIYILLLLHSSYHNQLQINSGIFQFKNHINLSMFFFGSIVESSALFQLWHRFVAGIFFSLASAVAHHSSLFVAHDLFYQKRCHIVISRYFRRREKREFHDAHKIKGKQLSDHKMLEYGSIVFKMVELLFATGLNRISHIGQFESIAYKYDMAMPMKYMFE